MDVIPKNRTYCSISSSRGITLVFFNLNNDILLYHFFTLQYKKSKNCFMKVILFVLLKIRCNALNLSLLALFDAARD